MKHVRIENVWYELAESAEGQHYVLTHQPMRPPDAQVIRGDRDSFQVRPDLLVWTQENWAGGEGQIRFDPSDPTRSYTITGLDVFTRPGTLRAGYDVDGGLAGTAPYLVIALGNLYAVEGTNTRTWASTDFSATSAITGITNDVAAVAGDADYLFVHESSTDNIRRYDGTTWTNHNDQCADADGGVILAEMGPYLYVWAPATGKVYEISKTTANTSSAETELHTTPGNSNIDTDLALMVAGDNRIYIATYDDQKTMIHEIIPTSAAGTGFGGEIAVLYGVTPETLFYAGGTLFMIAHDETPDGTVGPDRQIFYIDPEGSYGTLGSLRGIFPESDTYGPSAIPAVAAHGAKLGQMAFVVPQADESGGDSYYKGDLWILDLITGGYGVVGQGRSWLTGANNPRSLVFWEGYFFYSNDTEMVYWDIDTPGTDGVARSPHFDFGIAGEKILESIEVIMDPLPAGTSVTVGYDLDESSYTTVGPTLSTGDVGFTEQISTDSSTKTFRSMQFTISVTSSSGATPVIRAVNIYARVNRKIRVWDLLIDCSDDIQSGLPGKQIMDNIFGIGDNVVIDFVDAYGSHVHGEEEGAVDVILDSATAVLSQEGEGLLQIRLVEVT